MEDKNRFDLIEEINKELEDMTYGHLEELLKDIKE